MSFPPTYPTHQNSGKGDEIELEIGEAVKRKFTAVMGDISYWVSAQHD